jgi:hypothetical protein
MEPSFAPRSEAPPFFGMGVHVATAVHLMDEVNGWAQDDQGKWGALLDIARRKYIAVPERTPGGILLMWAGNRHSYSMGLGNGSSADISFYRRAVAGLERLVPQALADDHTMADLFMEKVRGKAATAESLQQVLL